MVMSENATESGPIEADRVYSDARTAPLSQAWTLIDSALAPRDRSATVKRALRNGTLMIIGYRSPRRWGDKPVLLSPDLLRLATNQPNVDLAIVSDELSTGNPRRGGFEFILCRVIRADEFAAGPSLPAAVDEDSDERTPIDFKVLAALPHVLRQLAERWTEAREWAVAEYGPEPPPANRDRLRELLIQKYVEDAACEKLTTDELLWLVPKWDRAFRPNDGRRKIGRWGVTMLRQEIKNVRPEAKKEAAERRAVDNVDG